MKYVQLPQTDLSVSRLCFGCWGIISDQHWGDRDRDAALDAIQAALDAGINFFDTAAMYGMGASEQLLGTALAGCRDRVVIASKLAGNRMHPAEVPQACEESLRALDTDYLDLLQTHWTSREVPLSDTWEAMLRLQEQGKIRHAGVCNAGLGDLQTIASPRGCEKIGTGTLATAGFPGFSPVTNQVPYSLLWRMVESEILPYCGEQNIGVLAYSPLMHGLLADKYRTADEVPPGRARTRHFGSHRPLTRHGEPGCERETFAALDAVRGICRELGRTMADVALAWCLQQPGVACVIAGAASGEQVRRNAASLEQPLPDEALRRLADATQALLDALGPNPDLWQSAADSRFR
jgi:aryl-alcohol dehydrogenase-like predicted oxidoreductase